MVRVMHRRQLQNKSVASAASQKTAGSGLAALVSLFHPTAVAFGEVVALRNKDL